MNGHLGLEFVNSELAIGAMFADLAQNYAKTGHSDVSAGHFEQARHALETAQQVFNRLTNIGTEERRSIETKVATLVKALERLSQRHERAAI